MFIISCLSQKGGVGKTTLVAHLSGFLAQQEGKILIIDLDPQQTLREWWDTREATNITFAEANFDDLQATINTARGEKFDYVFIDTPPSVFSESKKAADVADFVIMPTSPKIFDLRALASTVKIVREAGTRGLVILNRCKPPVNGQAAASVAEARAALAVYEMDISDKYVCERVAFSDSVLHGQTVGEFEPRGKAAREISDLMQTIEKVITC